MSWFGKKKTDAPRGVLLRPRRSRMFRRRVRESEEVSERKLSVWSLGYVFLWMVFFGAAVYVFFFSPLLRIDRRNIAQMNAVPEADIIAGVDAFLSGNILGIIPRDTLPVAFARRHTLERLLMERYPVFRSVRADFLFPETILLSFEEREKALVLCSGGPCFSVDERGFVYEGTPDLPESRDPNARLVVIDQSGKPIFFQDPVFSEAFLCVFPVFRRRLFEESDLMTSRVAETPSRLSDELAFRTEEGWTLRISAVVPPERSLLALRLLFAKTLSEGDRKNLDYIDLRTENRIFYLLKGEEEKEGETVTEEKRDDRKEEKKKKKDN